MGSGLEIIITGAVLQPQEYWSIKWLIVHAAVDWIMKNAAPCILKMEFPYQRQKN